MSTLTQFTVFPKLPTDIRHAIWELAVPQQSRIIGNLPCDYCLVQPEDAAYEGCAESKHPDWRLRYIVQPRDRGVVVPPVEFPILHACQESRNLLLARYSLLPRYIDLGDYDVRGAAMIEEYDMRFDVPYVNFNRDIFTIFEPWSREDIYERSQGPDYEFDPFIGLDRNNIQHIGYSEINQSYSLKRFLALDLQTLPKLNTVTLVVLGPSQVSENAGSYDWYPMQAEQLQNVDCELHDIPSQVLAKPLSSGESASLLKKNISLFKAWLWHAMHWDQAEAATLVINYPEKFDEYILGNGKTCPLGLACCAAGKRCKEDAAEWTPPFKIERKLLCEKTMVQKLDSAGGYESFFNYKEERLNA